jgi:ABC-type cobalamin/Fe3+-siderophores transport system ATPase subunit/ABC-type hemin transport system substrate-binding protein
MSLTLHGLSVDIAGHRIVSDIDIEVPSGSFVGLLGPNGSGKSTILKAIYRVHRPVAGEVLLNGADLLAMRPKDAARRVAVVAQESAVEFDFTVFEMVMIGRTPHKRAFDRDDESDHAIVCHAIDRVGCAALMDRSFNRLSGGEKQRVLIARAIAQGAHHLILDEPTNHLDIRYQVEVLEKLVGLHPDFLFAGWNYGLQVGTNLTPANLAKYGIQTLVLDESCAHVQSGKKSVSIDNTYQDLRNLGEIFGVEPRAQQVIATMQAQVSSVQKKMAGLEPVKVFDYDSGEAAPFTGPGLAMINALIQLGGGTNIFSGLKQSWTSVSWEQVTADQHQCIIINDYGTPTAQQKEKFLETSPVTKTLPAVKNRCFLPLSYYEVTPGPRNAEAVGAIARWLHPSAFGLPADGS